MEALRSRLEKNAASKLGRQRPVRPPVPAPVKEYQQRSRSALPIANPPCFSEPPSGLEPETYGLRNHCSTN